MQLSHRALATLAGPLLALGSLHAQSFQSFDSRAPIPVDLGSDARLKILTFGDDGRPDAIVLDGDRLELVPNVGTWRASTPLLDPDAQGPPVPIHVRDAAPLPGADGATDGLVTVGDAGLRVWIPNTQPGANYALPLSWELSTPVPETESMTKVFTGPHPVQLGNLELSQIGIWYQDSQVLHVLMLINDEFNGGASSFPLSTNYLADPPVDWNFVDYDGQGFFEVTGVDSNGLFVRDAQSWTLKASHSYPGSHVALSVGHGAAGDYRLYWTRQEFGVNYVQLLYPGAGQSLIAPPGMVSGSSIGELDGPGDLLLKYGSESPVAVSSPGQGSFNQTELDVNSGGLDVAAAALGNFDCDGFPDVLGLSPDGVYVAHGSDPGISSMQLLIDDVNEPLSDGSFLNYPVVVDKSLAGPDTFVSITAWSWEYAPEADPPVNALTGQHRSGAVALPHEAPPGSDPWVIEVPVEQDFMANLYALDVQVLRSTPGQPREVLSASTLGYTTCDLVWNEISKDFPVLWFVPTWNCGNGGGSYIGGIVLMPGGLPPYPGVPPVIQQPQ